MTGTEDSSGVPRRCSPEAELILVRVALGVTDDLRQAGIAAVYAGSSFDGLSRGIAGAVVFHAPYSDESAGVYVKWMPSQELMRQVVRPEGPDPRALALGTAAQEAMNTALIGILGAAGWEASDYFNSVTGESCLKVAKSSSGD
ncbi:hypothetical protein ACH4F6_13470 [Streptomyces sp. NPDC017936]|uniref:hypothetical protein n=1 Tax=Streptomyces sp. NPDC017936 TaxID=3365016 RepID=UPI0037B44ADB